MTHYWVSEMMLRARKKSAKRVGWNTSRKTLTSSWREVGAGQDIIGTVTGDEEDGRSVVRMKDQNSTWVVTRSEGGSKWPC